MHVRLESVVAGRSLSRSLSGSLPTVTMRPVLGRLRAVLLASTVLVALSAPVLAQDGTWVGGTPAGPADSDYGTAANWTPTGPPSDTAFFGASANTNISLSNFYVVGGWTFNAGASAHTFTINTNGGLIDFTGAGITINGGSASVINSGAVVFNNMSTAGRANIISSGSLLFQDASSAGSATITLNGGLTAFSGSSTAGNAVITANGFISFEDSATAGNATITNSNTEFIFFSGQSTAGSASITNSSLLQFRGTSTAGNAAITNAGNTQEDTDFSGSKGPNNITGSAPDRSQESADFYSGRTSSPSAATTSRRT
jgi:uncharacterized Zn-binding protein involved in type VI secretion